MAVNELNEQNQYRKIYYDIKQPDNHQRSPDSLSLSINICFRPQVKVGSVYRKRATKAFYFHVDCTQSPEVLYSAFVETVLTIGLLLMSW